MRVASGRIQVPVVMDFCIILLTGSYHLEQTWYGLMTDTVSRPAWQRAVVQVGHRSVSENAGRAIRDVPFRRDVDCLSRIVELPPEPFGRRVCVYFAQHVHALAPRRADHQHPVRFAARSVCVVTIITINEEYILSAMKFDEKSIKLVSLESETRTNTLD